MRHQVRAPAVSRLAILVVFGLLTTFLIQAERVLRSEPAERFPEASVHHGTGRNLTNVAPSPLGFTEQHVPLVSERERSGALGTRPVRLHGTVVLSDASERTFGRQGAPPGVLDPMRLGVSRESILRSVRVEVAETGVSATTDGTGHFFIDTTIPRRLTSVMLNIEGNLIIPQSGKPRVAVQLDSNADPVEKHVTIRVVPAVVARPTYQGKVITPRDLSNPEVRGEFLRQMEGALRPVLPPPEFAASPVSDSAELSRSMTGPAVE